VVIFLEISECSINSHNYHTLKQKARARHQLNSHSSIHPTSVIEKDPHSPESWELEENAENENTTIFEIYRRIVGQ
jgi:hypothetical protein